MNKQLQYIQSRLAEAKDQRGRLTKVAAETGISYRTIYGAMQQDASPSASTLDKLTDYFKKLDRKAVPAVEKTK